MRFVFIEYTNSYSFNIFHMTSSFARYAFWIGAFLVIATHIYMLTMGLPISQMMGHAVINILAGGLMIFGWMKK